MNCSMYLIQFLILYIIQPAPAPPETTTQAATTTSATTTSAITTACTSVTTWYYDAGTGSCARGPPIGFTGETHESLSDCCPAGDRCCDPCAPTICVDGPPVPTPPPITVSSCTFTLF